MLFKLIFDIYFRVECLIFSVLAKSEPKFTGFYISLVVSFKFGMK